MRFIKPIFMAMGLMALASCNSGPEQGTTNSGFDYQLFQGRSSQKAEKGDWVFYHFSQRVGEVLKGNTATESATPIPPTYRITGEESSENQGTVDPTFELLTKMSPGDSAVLIIPFDSLPWQMAGTLLEEHPNDSIFYLSLKVVEIQSDKDFTGGAATRVEELNEQFQAGSLEGVQYTADSLAYYIVKDGEGSYPTDSSTVMFEYYGIFPNGRSFSNSYMTGQPINFELGDTLNFAGWNKGLPLLKEGSSAVLFVPYQMAAGEQGNRSIPPRTDLIFHIDVKQVIN